MAKYSDEFKVKITLEYLEGRIGYRKLAKKYDVKSNKQITHWVS